MHRPLLQITRNFPTERNRSMQRSLARLDGVVSDVISQRRKDHALEKKAKKKEKAQVRDVLDAMMLALDQSDRSICILKRSRPIRSLDLDFKTEILFEWIGKFVMCLMRLATPVKDDSDPGGAQPSRCATQCSPPVQPNAAAGGYNVNAAPMQHNAAPVQPLWVITQPLCSIMQPL